MDPTISRTYNPSTEVFMFSTKSAHHVPSVGLRRIITEALRGTAATTPDTKCVLRVQQAAGAMLVVRAYISLEMFH